MLKRTFNKIGHQHNSQTNVSLLSREDCSIMSLYFIWKIYIKYYVVLIYRILKYTQNITFLFMIAMLHMHAILYLLQNKFLNKQNYICISVLTKIWTKSNLLQVDH